MLQTARDEFIDEVANTLLLKCIWNVVIGNSLKCRIQIFETEMPFLNLISLNFLQVQEQDTMNVCST